MASKQAKAKKDRRGRKFTAEQKAEIKTLFVQAAKQTCGVITEACDMVVIDGAPIDRSTITRWRREDAEFDGEIEGCSEIGLDMAESKLNEMIQAGDIRAIIFYLKCKGKRRGWVEHEPAYIVGEQQMIAPQITFIRQREEGDDGDAV